ncbi:MAG TPA: hypothetical protein VHO67_00350 [Polyangia bacterium]|nr:hypothetical protein [Polyangia bacterium]
MKMLRLLGVSGVLLWGAGIARAETGPSPETNGAVTTPSGAETPPPATYDNGTPATSPTVTPAAPSAAAGVAQDMALPPPGPPPTSQSTMPMESPNQAVTPVVPVVPVVPVQPVADTRDTGYHDHGIVSRVGVGLLLGGGYTQFTNSGIRNSTGDGGYWNVRVVEGTRQFVGFEAAYVGDARGMTGLGFSNNARLISNGVEGVLRLNVPIVRGPSLVEPFGFVGVGWQHYQITNNSTALADVSSKDDVLTVPFGGGLEFAYHGFMADARFTYRETYYNNLLGPQGGDLNNWNVGGQVGFEF